jgi:hypothetical protein
VGPRREGLTAIDVDGHVSIYNPETRQVVSLNATATAVWALSTGELDLDQVTEALAGSYQVDPQIIRDDVLAAVAQLRQHGLFEGGPA